MVLVHSAMFCRAPTRVYPACSLSLHMFLPLSPNSPWLSPVLLLGRFSSLFAPQRLEAGGGGRWWKQQLGGPQHPKIPAGLAAGLDTNSPLFLGRLRFFQKNFLRKNWPFLTPQAPPFQAVGTNPVLTKVAGRESNMAALPEGSPPKPSP